MNHCSECERRWDCHSSGRMVVFFQLLVAVLSYDILTARDLTRSKGKFMARLGVPGCNGSQRTVDLLFPASCLACHAS